MCMMILSARARPDDDGYNLPHVFVFLPDGWTATARGLQTRSRRPQQVEATDDDGDENT